MRHARDPVPFDWLLANVDRHSTGILQASQLGGKVAGARIRAKARGEDPEAGVRRARREVEAEEEASMRKRTRKA